MGDGDHAEANDWSAHKDTILAAGTWVRTDDQTITCTFAAAGSYSITSTNEAVAIGDVLAKFMAGESADITPDVTSFTITEGA